MQNTLICHSLCVVGNKGCRSISTEQIVVLSSERKANVALSLWLCFVRSLFLQKAMWLQGGRLMSGDIWLHTWFRTFLFVSILRQFTNVPYTPSPSFSCSLYIFVGRSRRSRDSLMESCMCHCRRPPTGLNASGLTPPGPALHCQMTVSVIMWWMAGGARPLRWRSVLVSFVISGGIQENHSCIVHTFYFFLHALYVYIALFTVWKVHVQKLKTLESILILTVLHMTLQNTAKSGPRSWNWA